LDIVDVPEVAAPHDLRMSGHWNKSKLFGLDEQLGQQLSLVGVAE